jgi:hypothetical protein
MRWLILAALLAAPPASAQSSTDFPRIPSVTSVTVVGPVLLFNLTGLRTSDTFRRWWAETEECTGISRSFEEVHWYKASVLINVRTGNAFWGLYFSEYAEIVLEDGQSPDRLENTVKHEILHHLINDTNHTEAVFTRCLPMGLGHPEGG